MLRFLCSTCATSLGMKQHGSTVKTCRCGECGKVHNCAKFVSIKGLAERIATENGEALGRMMD